MSKRNRTCSVEGALDVLRIIDKFNETGKGEKSRTHFADILTALEEHALFSREEFQKGPFSLPKDALKKAYNVGSGTDVDPPTRTKILQEARQRAEKIIGAGTETGDVPAAIPA